MPSEYSSLRVYQTESFVGVWIRFVFWTFRSDTNELTAILLSERLFQILNNYHPIKGSILDYDNPEFSLKKLV